MSHLKSCDVQVTLAEIEAAISKRLQVSMAEAAYLVRNISDAQPAAATSGGLDFGLSAPAAVAEEERKTIVLLAGNSSRLPLVRKMAEELFGVPSDRVVMDPQGVKAAVAQGACEEHLLKKTLAPRAASFTTVAKTLWTVYHMQRVSSNVS